MKQYLRSFMNRETLRQFLRLAVIGGLNTVVYFILFNVFLLMLGDNRFAPTLAVSGAYVLATGMSYALNRRWTFQIRQGWGSVRETTAFYVLNGIAWAVTVAIVQGADLLWGPLSTLQLNLANVSAVVLILVPKFAGYRDVVFRSSLEKEARS